MTRIPPHRWLPCALLAALLAAIGGASSLRANEPQLPNAKPVPEMQVLPLPHDQASFQADGRELTRYHFGRSLIRPFCYPLNGPTGRSHTRMGHPRDPVSHSHHNSVWISHHDVGGVDFWGDRGGGRIEYQRIEQYEDGPASAWLLATNAWRRSDGQTLLVERRRIEVTHPDADDQWLMLVDLRFQAAGEQPVTLGETPFGMIGVRLAKTIGVHDGGGRILNSQGQVNEPHVFRKPARWVDYSGPVTRDRTGGITLMDHVDNPGHPTPFHVRNDGWMGACLTLRGPIIIEPDKPLRLRYGLWVHAGVVSREAAEKKWREFSATGLPPMEREKR